MSRSSILVVICLVLSAPILIVKLPWFIPTIEALKNTIVELGIDGTNTYKDHLSSRLRREIFATCLYFFGFFSIAGLVGIAANFITGRIANAVVWFGVFLASSGLLIFEISGSASSSSPGYMIVFIVLPLVITLLSGCAFILRLRAEMSE